jgi:hypothetical protein
MALFKNVSGINQFIEEHRRTIGPNEEIELTDDDQKIRSYAKGLAKGGWLIPVLEDVVVQSVQQTIDNELDHVTHQPEQPFNIDLNIPMGGLKSLPETPPVPEDAVEAAIRRQIDLKAEEAKEAAIKRALGGYDDENVYVHTPVKPGAYGNIEHNKSKEMTRMTVPPSVTEGIAEPSAALDAATDKMFEAQMRMQYEEPKPTAELHLEKEAVKSPKVIPPKTVVKKPKK